MIKSNYVYLISCPKMQIVTTYHVNCYYIILIMITSAMITIVRKRLKFAGQVT